MKSLFYMSDEVEREVRRRIRLSLAAFQYELYPEGPSVMTDVQFDEESMKVDLSTITNRPDLDEWFRNNFQTHTGSWIQDHPELHKVERCYNEHYNS